MSKDVTVNGTNYEGVSIVELPLADGSGSGLFKDMDEISSGEMNLVGVYTNSTYTQKSIATIFQEVGITASYESGMFLVKNDSNVIGGETSGLITAVIIYNSENVLSQSVGTRTGNASAQSSALITTRTNKGVGGLIGVDVNPAQSYSGQISSGQSITVYEMPLSDVSWFLNNWQVEETTEETTEEED